MKLKNIKIYAASLIMTMGLSSCLNDLDQTPIDPDAFTELNAFQDEANAKKSLAKLYAALALTGQKGPDGNPDISGIDEGTSQFTRMYYTHQVLTTDEAIVGWSDPGLPDFHAMSWGSSNNFTNGLWARLAQEVSFTNSFIEKAQSLNSPETPKFIAEARFLRAYTYSVLMDLFGDVPIVTTVSAQLPTQSTRQEVFNFVESELLDLVNDLAEPRANEYGRVDKAAAWALLSRIYLNAEVYTGTPRYNDAITYADNVLNSGYIINMNDANNNGTAYDELFLADNDTNGAQNEFIFGVLFDGINSRTHGGSTFLVHAAAGDNAPELGIDGGWFGLRTTKGLVDKFEASAFNEQSEPIAWSDKRAMFYTDGHSYEIETVPNAYDNGYAVTKFKNKNSDGSNGKDSYNVDIDLPLIRTAEIYLIYAEAVLRGGNGDLNKAVSLINQLRARGYGDNTHNINTATLTLDFILDERARELYWEGQRRTDLIRFNQFTTNAYLWPFKGNVPSGTATSNYRRLFPIPADAMVSNANYVQNPGY